MNPFHGLKRNTAINLVGAALPLLVSLATVPVYIRVIGPDQYGVLVIVWALLGYFGAFDLGLSRAVANKVAQLRDASPTDRATVVWTALIVGFGVGLLGGVAMAGAGYVFADRLLDLPPALHDGAGSALVWLGVAVPLSNAMWLLIGSLEGQERFVVANGVTVISTVASQALPLCLGLLFASSLKWMLAGITIAALVGFLVALGACIRWVPLVRSKPFDRSLALDLSRYGGWVMVTGFVSPILVMADRLVIGAVSGVRAVAVYAVPSNLVGRLGIVPLSVARTLFPRFSLLGHKDAALVQRRTILTMAAVMAPIFVTAMFVLKPFLHLWVGEALGSESTGVGEILLLGAWLYAMTTVPYTYLQGQGRPDLPAKFHLLELPPYLLALWAGLHFRGIEGAAWAWTGRVALDAVLLFVAARLRGRALRGALVATVPIILGYLVVAVGTESVAPRVFAAIVLLAGSVFISLRLLAHETSDHAASSAPSASERLAEAQRP
jgi:O-antigen/teichoic acid export membrane protein